MHCKVELGNPIRCTHTKYLKVAKQVGAMRGSVSSTYLKTYNVT